MADQRQMDMEAERYYRARLDELRQRYEAETRPYRDALYKLVATRHPMPPIVVSADMIHPSIRGMLDRDEK